MYCSSCGKEINESSIYCNYCGKEVLKKVENTQVETSYETRNQNIQSTNNQKLDRSEINVRVVQEPNQNIGIGMEYAVHSNKTYIGYAWLTILLYIITFWIGGFIANIVYLNAAKTTRRIIKRDPPGIIFLTVLLILGIIGLVAGIVVPIAVTCSAALFPAASATQTLTSTTAITGEKISNVKDNAEMLDETNNQIAEPIILKGTGNQSTDFFDIVGGYTYLNFEGTGFLNTISADLIDKNGNKVQELSSMFSSSFSEILVLQKGKYFLNVETENPWKVTITQYSPKVKNLPYSFIGNSQNLSDLIIIDRLAEIKYNYTGSRNFIVQLNDENGQYAELIANELGSTSGSTTFTGDGNKYLISVEAATGQYVINVDYK